MTETLTTTRERTQEVSEGRGQAGKLTVITNLGRPAELLMLQGRPIGAPVFQMVSFVMNSAEEIQGSFSDTAGPSSEVGRGPVPILFTIGPWVGSQVMPTAVSNTVTCRWTGDGFVLVTVHLPQRW